MNGLDERTHESFHGAPFALDVTSGGCESAGRRKNLELRSAAENPPAGLLDCQRSQTGDDPRFNLAGGQSGSHLRMPSQLKDRNVFVRLQSRLCKRNPSEHVRFGAVLGDAEDRTFQILQAVNLGRATDHELLAGNIRAAPEDRHLSASQPCPD